MVVDRPRIIVVTGRDKINASGQVAEIRYVWRRFGFGAD